MLYELFSLLLCMLGNFYWAAAILHWPWSFRDCCLLSFIILAFFLACNQVAWRQFYPFRNCLKALLVKTLITFMLEIILPHYEARSSWVGQASLAGAMHDLSWLSSGDYSAILSPGSLLSLVCSPYTCLPHFKHCAMLQRTHEEEQYSNGNITICWIHASW